MRRIYIYIFIILMFTGVTSVASFFPLPYSSEITNISTEYNVDKDVIYSIIKIESDFREGIISNKGAIGLMQIMPPTGKWIAEKNNLPYSEEMLLDPVYNIKIGTLYLKYLIDRYDNNMEHILVAYNAGPTRLKDGSWKNFKETKNYLIKYEIVNFFYKIRLYFKP